MKEKRTLNIGGIRQTSILVIDDDGPLCYCPIWGMSGSVVERAHGYLAPLSDDIELDRQLNDLNKSGELLVVDAGYSEKIEALLYKYGFNIKIDISKSGNSWAPFWIYIKLYDDEGDGKVFSNFNEVSGVLIIPPLY